MKKKMMSSVLGLAMVAALTVCGGGQIVQAAEAPPVAAISAGAMHQEVTVGTWKANQGKLAPEDNKEAMKAFNKAAAKQKKSHYQVISVLGAQCVAGTNYSYLCRRQNAKKNAESSYVIVNVYQDLKGHSRITATKELLPHANENLEGGWLYNQRKTELEHHPLVERTFNNALYGLLGAHFDPIALVGRQVVAGTNYAIFCSITPVVPNGERHFGMVTVNDGLDGKDTLVTIEDVEIGLN